jgi:hypothetical protein
MKGVIEADMRIMRINFLSMPPMGKQTTVNLTQEPKGAKRAVCLASTRCAA